MLLIISIVLIIMLVWNFILNKKIIKFKNSIDELAYFIRSIDPSELNHTLHDKRYLSEANKIIDELVGQVVIDD